MSDSSDEWDTFDEIEERRARAGRSRLSRTFPVILLLFVCGTVAVVLRQNFGEFGALFQIAPVESSAPAPQVQNAMAQPVDELRQLVQDLQASLQQVADKLEVTQRQLASEQGERKLLSEQVGALSARVNARSVPNASVTTGAAPSLPKRPPIAPR